MTCSARLPVYALLIGAFIPNQTVWGILICKDWCCFGLYMAGILSALVSFVMKFFQRINHAHAVDRLPDLSFSSLKSVELVYWIVPRFS
jgi:ferrous iron transport protein B